LLSDLYTSVSNIIFGGERSFKPTSTASRLILVHSSSTTIHPQLPQHLPNNAQKPGDEPLPSLEGCGLNHQHPGCTEQKAATPAPPLSKQMWVGLYSTVGFGEIGEGMGNGKTRGDPGIGRPMQCVTKRTTTFRRGSFLPSFLLFPPTDHP